MAPDPLADAGVREGVIAIAQAAARAILAVYEGEFDVARKADASPLTEADLAAHRCIVAGLSRLTPDIPVLSEESAHAVAPEQRRGWDRLWLVDPLDGTREFVKRNGEFTVNIALIDDGAPVFGVIQAPVTGVLWHGVPGRGAFRRDADGERPLRVRVPATAPLRVAASRS
ncbi:MAG: 3'(2'),5'-bisphosphate nucleotidase CysQ, partial [Luteimonas sp.]|nr:3'(2'),5'-bisphosphate nucleotidase CysQ [Luteimonas sp.]